MDRQILTSRIRLATLPIVFMAGLLVSASGLEAQASFTGRVFTGPGTANGYGWGIGGDVGVQFPFLFGLPHMAGLFVNYHFGNDFLDDELGERVEQRIVFYGPQAAAVWYDKAFFLRGSGQIGAATVRHQVEGEEAVTQTRFMLGSGIMIGKRFGNVVLSIEPWFPIVINSDYTKASFALYINLVYEVPLIPG